MYVHIQQSMKNCNRVEIAISQFWYRVKNAYLWSMEYDVNMKGDAQLSAWTCLSIE